MVLLDVSGLHAERGARTLFQDLQFSIQSDERIGLIGVNGSGKSTLLRQLAGFDRPTGEIRHAARDLRLEYLPQNPVMTPGLTAFAQLFQKEAPEFDILRTYNKALSALENNPSEANMKALAEAQEAMDQSDAWQLASNARSILSRLGIRDEQQRVETLSGGMQKRLALASVLLHPANLLLLDEPTNHLDVPTIAWLEHELTQRPGALVVVTHDRYFLDHVCTEIVELDHGKLYRHKGNYSDFLVAKAEREAHESRRAHKLSRLYTQELAWMRKGAEARRTKQKARIERFHDLSSQLPEKSETTFKMDFHQARLGKKIISFDNVKKARNERVLFKDLTLTITKDDRIGIVGDNGIGKTTLLELFNGSIEPTEGIIEVGSTVRIGYYRQHSWTLPENQTVFQFIKDIGTSITLRDGSRISAGHMLEAFLFAPEKQQAPIGELSGGEKRRLYLLSVLMQQVNVLLLDEPSNDLDIHTLQVLESFLEHFPGPVLTVSHDRYFLDRICNRILAIHPGGKTLLLVGNYRDYLDKRPATSEEHDDKAKKPTTIERPKTSSPKMSWQEKQDYEHILPEIDKLETTLAELEEEMAEKATDYEALRDLQTRRDALNIELTNKIERWAELEEKIQAIASAKENRHG